jgi:hypothetical protein
MSLFPGNVVTNAPYTLERYDVTWIVKLLHIISAFNNNNT